MKGLKLFLLVLLPIYFSACSTEDDENIRGENTKEEIGRFDNQPFQWDFEYIPFKSEGDIFIGNLDLHTLTPSTRSRYSSRPSSSSGSGGSNYTDGESGILISNPTGIYVGAVYPISSIENGRFDREVVDKKKNPIKLLFKFPMDFRYKLKEDIDEWEYSEALEEALRSEKYKEHVKGLNEGTKDEAGYALVNYSSFSDIEKAFSGNANFAGIFKAKVEMNSKKVNVQGRLFAYLVGKNFKVNMTTPSNYFFAKEEDNRNQDLAYVKSISYGKIAYVSIESEYSFSEIKEAFEVGLKYKFIGGKMKYEKKTMEVFSKSKITIFTIAENSKESFYMNSIENLEGFFKTNFTATAYGKPIYTELSKVNDNSLLIPSSYSKPSGGRPSYTNTGRPSSGREGTSSNRGGSSTRQ